MRTLKEIYNDNFFSTLSSSITKCYPQFDQKNFLSLIYNKDWKRKELKERIRHTTLSLEKALPNPYSKNISILKQVASDILLPKENMPGLSLMIFADYVEVCGLDDFDTSIDALEYFTEFGSSEFAIRRFIIKYESKSLKKLLSWTKSNNHHVRRLASEGCRPRLPWAIALPKYKQDPAPIIPILEALKNDNTEYVRRSVANNLNDISKDNPKAALNLAQKWLSSEIMNNSHDDKNIEKLAKHGLRTLLKAGNTEALELFGFTNKSTKINKFTLARQLIKIGDNLDFSFELSLAEKSKIRLEYALYFVRKNGHFSKKIFQITQKEFNKGDHKFNKKHSLKKITTRKYYPGIHKISLVVNGIKKSEKEFTLESDTKLQPIHKDLSN